MMNHLFASTGRSEAEIAVSISYRIIELFSAGLYTSPNKAIEELVANSYDAMATNVHVIVPSVDSPDAVIWVIDDGTGMDLEGFRELWRIASSSKREPSRESKERPPIGKFGIGKLATYVLARELTYICKSKGEYRVVTMDYTRLTPTDTIETNTERLSVRLLSESEAQNLLSRVIYRDDEASKALPLFGADASESWTVVAMSNLTNLAGKLSEGRLRWVLSTALPLSPQFQLFLNGNRVTSSLEKLNPLAIWHIGDQDKVAERKKFDIVSNPPGVIIPGIGKVHGAATIHEESLFSTDRKADRLGRSHGIFVMVRGRLINIDDALFGVEPLAFAAFNRFRMVIHADGLDAAVRSTRESVLETEGVQLLQNYIVTKFYEVRQWYDNWLKEKEYEQQLSTKIGTTPQSLSRRPLLRAIKGVLDGTTENLLLTVVPTNLSETEKAKFLSRLESDLASKDGFIKEVKFEPLGIDRKIAVYDAMTGVVKINMLHPFYANYIEHYHNSEPFELLAVAEILTEAYCIEEGIRAEAVRAIIQRRDQFLRELVHSRRLSAPVAANYLRSAVSDPTRLEEAVAECLRCLGFEVSPIGGNNEPDGTAYARLGVRDAVTGERADYRITYDAKSTSADTIKAHTIGAATIVRHRDKYQAQYALVVGRSFAGDEYGAAATEAKQQGITLMTVEDLARLVIAASTRPLNFTKLRDLFENCYNSAEVSQWIGSVLNEEVCLGPLPEILQTIWDLQDELPDPVKFSAVAVTMRSQYGKSYREQEIKDWMTSLRRFAGGFVTIHEPDIVSLEMSPDRILQEINIQSQKLPDQSLRQEMINALIKVGSQHIG